MITSLSLANFKSWKRIPDMRLAPITGLFGTNSSGKTSILQFLLMLKQTAASADRKQVLNLGDDRSPVDLGGFRDLVYRGGVSPTQTPLIGPLPKSMDWHLSWDGFGTLKIADPSRGPNNVLFEDDKLTYSCSVGDDGAGRVAVKRFEYEFSGETFCLEKSTGDGEYELKVAGRSGFEFKRQRGRAWPLPAPIKCYGFPDQVNGYYQNASFLADFQLQLEQLLGRVYYLGPLREYPHRQYAWSGMEPVDVGHRGDLAIPAILASREREELISRGKGKPKYSVEEYAGHWLKELGLINSFDVRPVKRGSKLYEVVVRRLPGSPRVLITDVGFGVSQVLPALVLCYYVPEGSTILLEQPEIHLHPSVQAALADVLIDAVKVRRIQVIVESHSEHLLRRIQRRIAETALSREQVAMYFCNFKDDASNLVSLQVDEYGSIVNWPDDFFGDEYGEMAAMGQAVSERRRKERNSCR